MDKNGRGETAADGYGVVLYDPKDGKRKSLKVSFLRARLIFDSKCLSVLQ